MKNIVMQKLQIGILSLQHVINIWKLKKGNSSGFYTLVVNSKWDSRDVILQLTPSQYSTSRYRHTNVHVARMLRNNFLKNKLCLPSADSTAPISSGTSFNSNGLLVFTPENLTSKMLSSGISRLPKNWNDHLGISRSNSSIMFSNLGNGLNCPICQCADSWPVILACIGVTSGTLMRKLRTKTFKMNPVRFYVGLEKCLVWLIWG